MLRFRSSLGPVSVTRRLRVMSCDATVEIVGPERDRRELESLANVAVDRLHELESRWSRFRVDSEINRLNRAQGEPLLVSADTVSLVIAMVEGWYLTTGSYDPTLLPSLVQSGYATSRDDPTLRTDVAEPAARRGDPSGVRVDSDARVVQLPPGTTLDPGGIGKGLAADLVTDELVANGATGALVEIGGDLRAVGTTATGDAWIVRLADPLDAGGDVTLAIEAGAIATSSTRRRTWRSDGRRRHHLLDPATGESTSDRSRDDVIACTVVAGRGRCAEVLTKTAFVRGVDAALWEYGALGVAARVTTADGVPHETENWTGFVR